MPPTDEHLLGDTARRREPWTRGEIGLVVLLVVLAVGAFVLLAAS